MTKCNSKNYTKCRKYELISIAKRKGLSTTGNWWDILQRIMKYDRIKNKKKK